jgi:hypothetical protein
LAFVKAIRRKNTVPKSGEYGMKKVGLVLVVAAFAFTACGGKAKALKELGELIDSSTTKISEVSSDFTAAKDGKAVAGALDKFTAAMLEMKNKSEEIEKKYNFKTKGDEVPAELKTRVASFEAAVKAMTEGPMMTAMKEHGATPEVQEAVKKLQDIKMD